MLITLQSLPIRQLKLLTGGGLLLLSACATKVELPPDARRVAPPPAVAVPVRPGQTPAQTADAQAAAASAGGVASPATQVGPVHLPKPYGDAVAARFPEPVGRVQTPAFEPGRTDLSSNDEVNALLRSLVRDGRQTRFGTTVRMHRAGVSESGEAIEALVITRSGDASAAALASGARPTVMLVGGQHGNEPASAEAMLEVAQQLVAGPLEGFLDRVNVILLPRANPDGARLKQRANARGIDINRDHLLLQSAEARAIARLVTDFQPAVFVDAHEYTVLGHYWDRLGGIHRHDALLQVASAANIAPFITRAAEEWFRQPLVAHLAREGYSSESYHLLVGNAPELRVAMGSVRADVARNVYGLKNTVTVLLESRGLDLGRVHFKRRVMTQVAAVASVLRSTHNHAGDLLKVRQFVDAEVAALACTGLAVLDVAMTPKPYTLMTLDANTGVDRAVAVTFESAYELRPLRSRARPCGYWLAADQTLAVERLRAHGVRVREVMEKGVMLGDIYAQSAPAAAGAPASFDISPALIDMPEGSFYVSLEQPTAHLVIAALEPDLRTSYLANGVVTALDKVRRIMQRY